MKLGVEIKHQAAIQGMDHIAMQEHDLWLSADGVHLSAAGHTLLAQTLAGLLLAV